MSLGGIYNCRSSNEDNIKFLTLRRRGAKMIEDIRNLSENKWQKVKVEGKNRKHQEIKVYDEFCNLRNYNGKVRQVVLTEHGREQPSFLITNDFDIDLKNIVKNV
ncbi:MAG: hypothetical protein HQK84_11335 [Nitrospinae bacterium]|nr:hypothetical protein [Nitrospinota bacterium]